MKNVNWVAYVIVALGVVGIIYTIWNANSTNPFGNYAVRDTAVVETNHWKPYISISNDDTCSVYEVLWDQKYGATKKSYCMVVFRNESAKQYKLIAPWLDGLIIEYQNTNDIKFNKVLKENAPNYNQ